MMLAVGRPNVDENRECKSYVPSSEIDQYAGKYKICQKSETSLGNLLITQ